MKTSKQPKSAKKELQEKITTLINASIASFISGENKKVKKTVKEAGKNISKAIYKLSKSGLKRKKPTTTGIKTSRKTISQKK